MNATQDAPVADNKKIDFKIDLNEKLGESMENSFDAVGKIFGGLVGAIKEAIGPELMKSLGAANWLGQIAQCLETISKSLSAAGTVPDEPAGQLSFLKDQLDKSLDGTKLEAQKATFSVDVLKLRDDFEKNQRMSAEYQALLGMSQQIFGEEVLPTLEVDAHGLLLDCRFVGLPGQIAFFEQKGNLNGFDKKLESALDLATSWGYAKARNGFDPAGFDYQQVAKIAGIKYNEGCV